MGIFPRVTFLVLKVDYFKIQLNVCCHHLIHMIKFILGPYMLVLRNLCVVIKFVQKLLLLKKAKPLRSEKICLLKESCGWKPSCQFQADSSKAWKRKEMCVTHKPMSKLQSDSAQDSQ